MKKILLSTATVLFVVGALVVGGTGAFFSDTELSSGNTFTAGAIDLRVDNTSYYNGLATSTTSWLLANLTIQKFFYFFDLKPGDYGEDTISLHVDNNDAYLCANVKLTSNDDNGINGPEAKVDTTDGPGNGELASNVNFIWWADDGDNVLESNETVISQGPIGAIGLNGNIAVPLADSANNIWTGTGGPAPGGVTQHIGKAWCFGAITPMPLGIGAYPQGPAGDNDSVNGAGKPEDGGIHCNGSALNNSTQTDSLTADVTFTAIQARNNPGFLCSPQARPATLTLVKSVNNGSVGGALVTDWTLTANGPSNISGLSGSAQVTNVLVGSGSYTLGETGGPPGYGASQYSCVINLGPPVVSNNLNLNSGDTAVCTVTNTVQACSAGQEFADNVINFDQGRREDGALIGADRSDPTKSLGAPQTTGTPYDPVVTPNSFVSLGFGVGTTSSRSLTLGFTNTILNGSGADFRVYEVTGGNAISSPYPDEKIKVEVSQDGINWFTASSSAARDADVDLTPSGLGWAKFVKLTDINTIAQFPGKPDADGYDVDAVKTLNCAQTP